MNRREALSAVSVLLGGTVIGSEIFLSGCSRPETAKQVGFLTNDNIAFLDEVGETILPATSSSPGAKETRIGEYMNLMITDCYSAEEQTIFAEGITELNEASKKKFGDGFQDINPAQRHELLLEIEAVVKKYNVGKKDNDPAHYYTMMKQLTLLGYFSSEAGATKALRHVAVPGRFDACVPLEKGQKAWA